MNIYRSDSLLDVPFPDLNSTLRRNASSFTFLYLSFVLFSLLFVSFYGTGIVAGQQSQLQSPQLEIQGVEPGNQQEADQEQQQQQQQLTQPPSSPATSSASPPAPAASEPPPPPPLSAPTTTIVPEQLAPYSLPPSPSNPSSPTYTDLLDAEVTANQGNGGGGLLLSAQSGGEIPVVADGFVSSVLAFGYGWINSQTLDGMAVALHPGLRDPNLDPNVWNSHLLGLSPSGCVEEFGAAHGNIQIEQNQVRMTSTTTNNVGQDNSAAAAASSSSSIPSSGGAVNINPSLIDTATSFLIVPSMNFMTCNSGLNVIFLDAIPVL